MANEERVRRYIPIYQRMKELAREIRLSDRATAHTLNEELGRLGQQVKEPCLAPAEDGLARDWLQGRGPTPPERLSPGTRQLLRLMRAVCEEMQGPSVVQLSLAVRLSDLEWIEELLAAGVNPNNAPAGPTNLLHFALLHGNQAVVDALIAGGAKIGLMEACALGDLGEVERLLAEGADVNQVSGEHTPLNTAIRMGQVALAHGLLEHGAAPDHAGEGGLTPLMYAAFCDRPELVAPLVARGAAIGLHEAAMLGDEPAVRRALSQGADLSAPNAAGFTPFTAAIAAGCEPMVRLLLDARIGVENGGTERTPPLVAAIDFNRPTLVRLLVEAGANPNAHAALFHACLKPSRVGALRELLRLGADLGQRSPQGITALQAACARGNAAAVQVLLEAGADPNDRAEDGSSALHAAVCVDAACVQLLLEHGAEVDARKAGGPTPLAISVTLEHLPAVRLLVQAGADIHAAYGPNHTVAQMARGRVAAYLVERQIDRFGG